MPLKSTISSFGSVRIRLPVASPGQRIGIMGGSFNPPHEGHVLITQTALRRLRLDAVWWVVTPGNPLKSHNDLPSLDDRMTACRAMMHQPRVRITGFEQALGTPFTAATIAYVQRRYPLVHFVWIMGADNMAGLHRWQQWRSIVARLPVAVVDRPGWRHRAVASVAARSHARAFVPDHRANTLATRRAPAWTLLGGPLSNLSSTALRAGK